MQECFPVDTMSESTPLESLLIPVRQRVTMKHRVLLYTTCYNVLDGYVYKPCSPLPYHTYKLYEWLRGSRLGPRLNHVVVSIVLLPHVAVASF
jgi:hypothetical protein